MKQLYILGQRTRLIGAAVIGTVVITMASVAADVKDALGAAHRVAFYVVYTLERIQWVQSSG